MVSYYFFNSNLKTLIPPSFLSLFSSSPFLPPSPVPCAPFQVLWHPLSSLTGCCLECVGAVPADCWPWLRGRTKVWGQVVEVEGHHMVEGPHPQGHHWNMPRSFVTELPKDHLPINLAEEHKSQCKINKTTLTGPHTFLPLQPLLPENIKSDALSYGTINDLYFPWKNY